MSDQDRDRLPNIEDEDTDTDDVEAHSLGGRQQFSGRGANDDSSDDVEAHKLV